MKKVVFVHMYNDRSGSPRVLRDVVCACQEAGIPHELITSKHKNGFLDNLNCKKKELFYARTNNKLITLLYYLISQCHLFLICLGYRNQDVVFYINTMMPFGAALTGKLIGKDVYYHIHETSINPKLLKNILRSVIKLTAKKIIYVSKYLQEVEGFEGKEQFIVYNAIDSDHVINSYLEILKNRNREYFNVLMVCSLKKYKGVNDFIKIASLCKSYSNIRFLLVLNATQDEINEYFKDMAISDNVTIYTRQLDVSIFYLKSDLVLNLSRPNEWVETFGLTIIEALSYSLPVIVPTIGGPAEIVCDGREGYLINSNEHKTIAQTIIRLSEYRNEYITLSMNAMKRASDFGVEMFKKNILKVIN